MTYGRVVAGRRGGPEVLEVVEAALPEPAPGQARVRIQAAGVSYADILMCEGVHPETPAGPFIPGPRTTGQRFGRRQAGADQRS